MENSWEKKENVCYEAFFFFVAMHFVFSLLLYQQSENGILQDGLRITYFWIKEQIEKEKAQGVDLSLYGSSKVVGTQAPVQLGSLRAADGKE